MKVSELITLLQAQDQDASVNILVTIGACTYCVYPVEVCDSSISADESEDGNRIPIATVETVSE
jgi:hypothetical protein